MFAYVEGEEVGGAICHVETVKDVVMVVRLCLSAR